MLRSVIAAIAITITVPNIGHAQSSSSVGQKAILVTGASTGIGRKLTEQLAADGYFIYATARKDADLQALATIKNVQGVRLDVTHPDDITAAVETVTKGGRGLYALVNNAGIGSASPLTETPPEEFASMMAVNVTGPRRPALHLQSRGAHQDARRGTRRDEANAATHRGTRAANPALRRADSQLNR